MTKRERGERLFRYLASQRRWRRTVAFLWRKVQKCKGFTTLNDDCNRITVMIDPALPWPQIVDTMTHELGHAAEFDEWDSHGPKWGEHHAFFYRAWDQWTSSK